MCSEVGLSPRGPLQPQELGTPEKFQETKKRGGGERMGERRPRKEQIFKKRLIQRTRAASCVLTQGRARTQRVTDLSLDGDTPDPPVPSSLQVSDLEAPPSICRPQGSLGLTT